MSASDLKGYDTLLQSIKDVADNYQSLPDLQDSVEGFHVPFVWKKRASTKLPQDYEDLSARLRRVMEEIVVFLGPVSNEVPASSEVTVDQVRQQYREFVDGLSVSLLVSKRLNPRDRLEFERSTSQLLVLYMDAYPLAITHPDTSASNIKERDLELNVGRPLVVCLDGTGNEGSTSVFESNVARFYAMLMKGHNVEQKVYYQAGIGTYTSPWFLTSLARNFSKALDKAIAWNLNTHVQEAYKYIMDHYENDSKICIFGFSRGAYIARALAGMIQKVGLLPPGNDQQIPFAYRLYEDNSESGWKRSTNFKKAQCVDVDIDFLGVWDTVDSVGFIRGKELPFTKSNRSVKVFRHALSLDERRAKFHQFCWHWSSGKEAMQGVEEGDMLKAGKKLRKSYIPDVQEVWFAGCHSDVGGSVTAEQIRPFPPSLAHISLRWMIQQCFDTDTGIIFDLKRLKEIGLEFPEFEGQIIEASRPIVASKEKKPMPSKELEDLDATRSIHDQLSENWFWWILEVCWLRHPVQKKDGSWGYKRTFNLGKGRKVQESPELITPNIHRSVKTRMEESRKFGEEYTPRADLGTNVVQIKGY